jgi:UDP-N-acetylglucosamine 2-epimerase (non-hydrolysing)/GDP/UDP-N,N'-diacetylbacillosamine 2-epimerase (hydrolysing)
MRKIAVFTGNRAEYGLQYPILKAIQAHSALKYFLLVSGAHLDKDFGKTLAEIQHDGFEITREIKIEMSQDSLFSTAQAIGSGVINISKALEELKPDVLVIYADRFEGFAAVIAGTQMGIPTAHIEGGDITEGGALDDSVRHAMTKLAHLHFTTNEDAARRIRAMGEEPWRVFNVGFPAIDLIAAGNYASKAELEKRYGIDFRKPVILFTQHSVATECDEVLAQLEPSLDVLEILAREGCQIIATYPNNDAGGKRIIDALNVWGSQKIKGIQVFSSLGRYNYHGILYHGGTGGGRGVCVGNSSSGIKETPALGCPAVNIGSRQQGRLRATNVIDVGYDKKTIVAAIRKALFDDEFRGHCRHCENPYGLGDAGKKIADVLSKIELGSRLIKKKMTI